MKMKKVLATILAVTMIACVFAIGVSAAEHETYYYTDGSDIICFNGLDFRESTNTWAVYDEDKDKWVSSGWKAMILTYDDDSEHFALYNDGEDVYKIYDPATDTFCDSDSMGMKYYGQYVYSEWGVVKDASGNFYFAEIIDKDAHIFNVEEYDPEEEDFVWNEYTEGFELVNEGLGVVGETQNGAYISKVSNTNPQSLDKKLDWELSEDGEFITLTSLVENMNAGIFFEIDDTKTNYQVGEESKGYPEYVSIRIRNRSSATKLSFGFITSNTNSGDRFMTRSVSDLEIDANSDEWKVYTFSMAIINGDMKHDDNKGGHAWGNKLRTFGIFPFGYGAEDGEGAYKGADMDIDYIVIGSEEYCKSYKSEIQALEESVTNIELVTAPTKTVYHVGEALDLDGLQIKATYSDGSNAIITDCSAVYDLTTASDSATVTLKYGTNTIPLTYNVQVVGIDSVEITAAPEKTTYKVSDIADGLTSSLVSGTKIKVTYTDGTIVEDVTPSIKSFSLSSKEPGDQMVTINYYGSTASYAAKVTTVESLKIDDIEKAIYYGDEITAADLSITCVYSDGEEVALADSGFEDQLGELVYDTTVFGEIEVSVTLSVSAYDIEVTGTTKATVIAPTGIKVVKDPDKTTYQVDDKLDTTGLEVAYDYGDGVEARVIDNEKLTFKANLSEPGKTTVKVSDGMYNTTFDITIEGTVATTANSTVSTTSTTSTTATTASSSGGGCGSMIGIGAIAVIACISVAGAAVIRKKED